MRALTGITLFSTLWLSSTAQLIPFLTSDRTPDHALDTMPDPAPHPQQQQQPLTGPGIQLPPKDPPDNRPANPTGPMILSDIISTERDINTFAGYARDVESVADRLDDGGVNTTVLAPVNAAVWDLPRKPWEDPREYAALGAQAYDGDDGFDRARRNLRRFTEAHIVPVSPWKEGEKVKSLAGGTLWWETRKGEDGEKMVVQPGDIEVRRVVGKVANGEMWIVEKVVNYAV